MGKHRTNQSNRQGKSVQSEVVADLCYRFLRPMLSELAGKLDRRVVQTLLEVLLVIVIHRHRNQGLLLSEMGGYLLGGEHAPAGTKRISSLLGHPGWSAQASEAYLWQRADQVIEHQQQVQEDTYVIWDESVIEKPETLKAERLCAVRSSKARRLKRIKPGFFNPPAGRPIFVPGWNWLQVLVAGRKGAPTLAHIRFWTTRGQASTTKREEEHQVLRDLAKRWGKTVIHIWDRGFAGAPWLGLVILYQVRFIVRWQKNYKLIAPDGRHLKTWECTRGKRSLDHRLIYDARRRGERTTGILFVPVRVPDFPQLLLTLIVSRPGQGRLPWYLLTNEPISSVEDAWRMVLAYNRRWQVEVSIRYSKSELAFESLRLRLWSRCLKLFSLAALAQAFLFSLLHDQLQPLHAWLLQHFCHRTGKRRRTTASPLYLLRLALSLLWSSYRPTTLPRLDSG